MVTITIITLITGVVMSKYSSFNGVVLLKNQAYEMALDIREAQVFGVSARVEGTEFRGSYGIYFDINSPNEYILFQDEDEDSVYDDTEEIGQKYTIDSRFEIKSVCSDRGSGCDPRDGASISFKRPNFDAYIREKDSVGLPMGASDELVSITISSIRDSVFERTITVRQSGQISVE